MFTGCIKHIGTLQKRTKIGANGKLTIATPLAERMEPGASLAVNGACLTVESIDRAQGLLHFHTLGETLRRTNLGLLAVGRRVNLEEPLRAGDPLDGHFVTGHIDGTSMITTIERRGDDRVVSIRLPEEEQDLLVLKGSVTVDGVSLTVAALDTSTFAVHLIPYTFLNTNFAEATEGRVVNLEFDLIGKYVQRLYEARMDAG